MFVRSFTATKENGSEVILSLYQDMIDAKTRGVRRSIPGRMSIKDEDGGAVNRIDQGKYEIVQTGEIVTSDDPDAP